MICQLVVREDPLRQRVEHHVQRIYEQAHGAVIRSFPELMVADIDDAGGVLCAAGLRRAADGFFSECYLDRPLEELLGELACERIGRERIIEVTSLASMSLRSLARLIETIIAFGRGNRMDWAVFTITPRLKRLLCHLGLPIAVLCPAEASRVENPEDWGRYYDTRPMVTAMRDFGAPRIDPPLGRALESLRRRSPCLPASARPL